jgi:photosystem II stability/assembly factor-like uncharacterized protein
VAVVCALGLPTAAIAAAARVDRGTVDVHTIDTAGLPPATATTVPPHARGALPRGTRVNPDDLLSLSFADPQHGFAYYGGQPLGVAATNNGGATWRATEGAPKNVSNLEFTSVKDGWAFRPDRLVTHDGGRTWTPTHPGGDVDALDVIGSSVWSLVGCSSTPETPCIDHLERSDDGGRTWRSTRVSGLPAGPAELDRVDGQRAFVWSALGSLQLARAIVATSDAGTSWAPRKNPCNQMLDGLTLAGLSAVNGFDLWASCSQSGIPTAAKEVFRSPDGGRSWILTARVGMGPAPDIGKLPSTGDGADLIAISDQVAILTSGRGTISVSTDAGRVWSPAITFDEFLGTITKLRGSDTVWVGSAHSGLESPGVWRATDGIHFRLIARGTPY